MSQHLVFCNLHGRPIRGTGTTRVLNSVVFHFCTYCWGKRFQECEQLMIAAASLPKKAQKASA